MYKAGLVAAFVFLQELPAVLPASNPLLAAAIHTGGLAVTALALWIILARTEARHIKAAEAAEQRYSALALGYKEDVRTMASALVRFEGRVESVEKSRMQDREELLKRIEQIVRAK